MVSLRAWIFGFAFAAVSALQGEAQSVRGRVVAEPTRTGIEEATITIRSTDSVTIIIVGSDKDGFFEFTVPDTGTVIVSAAALGFKDRSARVRITDAKSSMQMPALVLEITAVELDRIDVEARRGANDNFGSGRASHVVAAQLMATLESHGASLNTVIKELGGGLRSRRINRGGRLLECIESTRRVMNMQLEANHACNMVTIVVDGIVIGQAVEFVRDARVVDFESIEYVPPLDAGQRYGMEASANGALVFWTRGRGPHKSDGRNGGGARSTCSA